MSQSITADTVAPERKRPMTREEKRVILASSAGTIFEWYDSYLYGSLAAIIGALFFGRLGDLIGRKYTFLMTILIMGVSTFVVGLLPGYETIGWVAPVVLIARIQEDEGRRHAVQGAAHRGLRPVEERHWRFKCWARGWLSGG